jgi:hypothetical protein
VDQVDEVFGQLWRNLFLRSIGKVKTDMCFQNLAHKRVDAAADGCQQHELAATILIGCERALNGVELAANFSYPLQQFQFFPVLVGHGRLAFLDNTHLGYGINPVGVSILHPFYA